MNLLRVGSGLLVIAAFAMSIGGCPGSSGGDGNSNENANDNGSGGSGAASLAGRWSGTLDCEITQSLNGTPGSANDGEREVEIEFDDAGVLVGVTVLGFSGSPEALAEVSAAGDEVTLDALGGATNPTLVVSARSILYSDDSARIVLDIEYSGQSGNLAQTGSAVQTVDVRLEGEQLRFEVDVEYDVTQVAGTISLETGETTGCETLIERA
ncbi:MAG: hypothetical protein ACKVS9_13750 [Phycisphaerae bacterium]